jgi:hypothetical protein
MMVVLEEGGSATLNFVFFFFFFSIFNFFNKSKKKKFFNVTWHQQTLQNWLKIQQNDHFHIHEKLMQLKLKKIKNLRYYLNWRFESKIYFRFFPKKKSKYIHKPGLNEQSFSPGI